MGETKGQGTAFSRNSGAETKERPAGDAGACCSSIYKSTHLRSSAVELPGDRSCQK